MTRLIWDDTGKRFYETGVDRAVLYIMDNNGTYPLGVAWNGMTAVTESPSGGEPTPLYGDNIKYLTLMSAEDFAATIEAYTYPEAFGECDGTKEIGLGLGGLVSQQSRKKFGLVYRTKLGNDVAGDSLGYKLHLLYGCLASPSEKAYATVNDSPEAITFSWEVATTPTNITGFQPTSLIVIDSTQCRPDELAALESQLFGDTGITPNLPLPDEVKRQLDGWLDVSSPSGWTWSLPFTIQHRDGEFRPDPNFSLRNYALDQIAAGTTYYVSTTGNDSNDGLSWETAKRNPYIVFALSDARIVYIGAGYYYRNSMGEPNKSMAVIGVGNVYLTSDCINQVGSFTLVGNHYEATVSRSVRSVHDGFILDAYGGESRLALAASSGNVDSTPGSWYLDDPGNIIYIRLADSRAPDTNVRYYEQGGYASIYNSGVAFNRVVYFENLNFHGGWAPGIVYTGNGGNIRMYMNNVKLKYAQNGTSTYNSYSVWGGTEAIFFNVTNAHSPLYDGFSYKTSGGITPKAIEYNCKVYDHGDGSTDQASTSHDGVQIVRIMGEYYSVMGRSIIADVGGSIPNVGKSWNLGCDIHSPKESCSVGAITADTGVDVWCDQVNIHDIVSGYDLSVDPTATILYHDITSGGLFNNGGGGISPYEAEYT